MFGEKTKFAYQLLDFFEKNKGGWKCPGKTRTLQLRGDFPSNMDQRILEISVPIFVILAQCERFSQIWWKNWLLIFEKNKGFENALKNPYTMPAHFLFYY